MHAPAVKLLTYDLYRLQQEVRSASLVFSKALLSENMQWSFGLDSVYLVVILVSLKIISTIPKLYVSLVITAFEYKKLKDADKDV